MIAITGTPGVGKTTIAALLMQQGETVTSVLELAKQHDCIAGFDEEDDAEIIDLDELAEHVDAEGFLDGHLAHLLPVQEAWVLRLDPLELRQRLQNRGYQEEKIRENLEAECLDIVLQEALEDIPKVLQVNGTGRTPEEILSAFVEKQGDPLKNPPLEQVDWSHRLPV